MLNTTIAIFGEDIFKIQLDVPEGVDKEEFINAFIKNTIKGDCVWMEVIETEYIKA